MMHLCSIHVSLCCWLLTYLSAVDVFVCLTWRVFACPMIANNLDDAIFILTRIRQEILWYCSFPNRLEIPCVSGNNKLSGLLCVEACIYACVCVCVCAYTPACVCMCVCMHACMHVYVCAVLACILSWDKQTKTVIIICQLSYWHHFFCFVTFLYPPHCLCSTELWDTGFEIVSNTVPVFYHL